MKESRKRPESDDTVDVAGKRPRTPVISEDEVEEDFFDILAGFPIEVEEETVMEAMKVLEEEISFPNITPSSSMTFSSSSSSFVTSNGNEESCGPSFSDSASTVMASIDMGSMSISYLIGHTEGYSYGSMIFPVMETEPWVLEEEREFFWSEVDEASTSSSGINGCDGGESDDEWLARVLSGPPFLS